MFTHKKNIISSRFTFALGCLLFLCNIAAAQNLVVAENKKPGTTDWLLDKVRADTCRLLKPYKADLFCRQQDIEGYCSALSIKAGEVLNVFVSTNPVSSFTVDIYRMGYYGGKGGRKMMSIGPVEGHSSTYTGRWRKKSSSTVNGQKALI